LSRLWWVLVIKKKKKKKKKKKITAVYTGLKSRRESRASKQAGNPACPK
jgi:hypothetical protein